MGRFTYLFGVRAVHSNVTLLLASPALALAHGRLRGLGRSLLVRGGGSGGRSSSRGGRGGRCRSGSRLGVTLASLALARGLRLHGNLRSMNGPRLVLVCLGPVIAVLLTLGRG